MLNWVWKKSRNLINLFIFLIILSNLENGLYEPIENKYFYYYIVI